MFVIVETFCLSAVRCLAPGSQELIVWSLPRCLKSPLDSLSITRCWLTESDLTHLSQSPDISQLKSLDLSGVTMTDFRPEFLQVLLEKVTATLQELDFDVCGITDSQLEAFLPALSLCSQLRSFSLCENPPVHGRRGEAAATHHCAALLKARALSCASGDLQTSECSPGEHPACSALGSAVGDSEGLGTSQDHLD